MAISDSQKLDYLWKKVGYSYTKTDTPVNKLAPNESIPSPAVVRVDKIMRESTLIPTIIPLASADVVTVYSITSPIECARDLTSTTNRTWKTNLTDWISPEFGATYQIKVYVHTSGAASNAASAGTQVFATGSGADDEWFFDYQSGVLNFIGTNLPNGVSFTGKSVYIIGARYTGIFGIGNEFGNISFNGDIIQSTGNIVLSPNGVISANGNTITNVENPINPQDAVTLLYLSQYVSSQLGGIASELIIADTSVKIIDDDVVPGQVNITADGVLVGKIAQLTTEFYNQLNVSGGTTINSNQTNNNFIVNGTNNTVLMVAHSSSNTVTIGGTQLTPTIGATLHINGTDSILLPKGTTGDRPGNSNKTDIAGMLRFNTTLGAVEFFDGDIWKSASTEYSTMTSTQFSGQSIDGNVDGVNTVFTLPQVSTTSSTIVSINGIMQIPVLSYEVDGTLLIFTEPPTVTDIVDVRCLVTTITVSRVASPNGVTLVEAKNAGILLVTGTNKPIERVTIDTAGTMQLVNGTRLSYTQLSVPVYTSPTVVDRYDYTVYRSAKYLIEISNTAAGEYEVIDALVIHNGTTAFIKNIDSTFTGTASIGLVSVAINGTNVELLCAGTLPNNTVKVFATYIKI